MRFIEIEEIAVDGSADTVRIHLVPVSEVAEVVKGMPVDGGHWLDDTCTVLIPSGWTRTRMSYDEIKRVIGGSEEFDYAKELAVTIWEKYFKTNNPEWKPCDDLMGVLTQIDNMSHGLLNDVDILEQSGYSHKD